MESIILVGHVVRIAQDERRDGMVKIGVELDNGLITQLLIPKGDATMFGYGDRVNITLSLSEPDEG